jgi:hypothetical protein
MRQEDRFSIVVSSSRRPRRVDYIIDSSSFHGCSFVRAWRPFLRPGLRVQTGRAQGVVKAGRRAGLPLASMLPGHALTEAQQVLHARCNWPLRSALPVTPDDSVDKKRSKHYRRRFVSLACQNEPAAPPRSYLLLEIARVVGLLGACEQCQLEAKRVAEQRGLNRTLERGFSGLKCGGPCAGASH